MSATDLLQQLQATFPAGQTAGTFDATQVQGGEYASLLSGMGIPTTLSLTSAGGWQSDGTNVTLAGTSSTTILGVDGPPVAFRFTPSGDDWVLLLDVTLPASWTFAQSFPSLTAGIFAELTLADGQPAALAIASGATTDPLRLVSGAAIAVQAGLTFYGQFTANSSAFAQLAWLIDEGSMQPAIGPIAYAASDGSLTMQVVMASTTLSGLFGDDGPALDFDVALYSGLNEALAQYEAGVRFDASLDFGASGTVDLAALLTSGDQPILDLTLSGSALAFPDPATLERFFGSGNGIAGALPDKFNGGNLVQVNAITFGIGVQSHALEYAFLSVGALTGQTWDVWSNVIELGNIVFQFSIVDPFGATPTYAFDFSAVFTLGEVPIVIQAQLPGEILSGRLDPTQPPPPLHTLVQQVFGFTNGLPDDLEISRLDFSANIPQSTYSADLEISGDWSFPFGTDNTITFEALTLGFAYDASGAGGTVSAKFAIDGDNQFDVALDMTSGNTTFTGSWEDSGTPLTFQDIAIALGMYGLPNLPQQIDLSLQSAHFEFDSGAPTFSFDIETASYGGAVLVAGRNAAGTAWGFIYGMEIGTDLSVDLTNIPVVGHLVPAGDDVITLTDLRVVAATSVLPAYTLTDAQQQIVGSVVNSGLVLAIDLQVGTSTSLSFSVRFGGSDDGTSTDVPPSTAKALAALPAAGDSGSASAGPQATWVNVQRAFGPVQINRVGFTLTPTDDLGLLLDAAVSLGGLTIGLTGLEADIPIQSPFTPGFGLAGLQVSYASGGTFSIGGGLAKVPGQDPAEYTGELQIAVGSFGATAFGSYTTVNGKPSLFAFVFIDAPLGGPACFFVTGLAGGFGYNRSLQLPTIANVSTYPLVQGAMGTLNADQTQTALDADIQPEEGEDWLAAGVRFTSFEMVKSFALLTVAFGTNLEIALLGESTVSIPVSTVENPQDPVAQAGLMLLVDVQPTNGVVSVSAQLTPDSYVLSKAAQLTGGFAFYVWFGRSPHAGDFVVTLGGYNPYYTPPGYYPQVPRLGLNWTVSSELTIKGGLYFALTPSVIMAGGSLDATWQSGNLKAWFDAEADFLIRFKPFSYLIDVSIRIGVSAKLNFGVTSKTVTVHAGVALTIWGPPFGGIAKVDLSIVSFTLKFGAKSPPGGADIGWTEFTQSFLPPAQSGSSTSAPAPRALAAATAAAAATSTNSLLTITAPTGIRSSFTQGSATVWAVDAGALVLVIGAQIPSTAVTISPTTALGGTDGWETQLGIGPMGAGPGGLSSTLSIQIQRDGAPDEDDWTATAVLGKVPAGLWRNTSNQMQTDGTVDGALTGVTLVPSPPGGESTVPVPVQELLAGDPPVRDFAWSDATVPQGDAFDQSTAMAQLQSTLVDGTVAGARSAILAALAAQGLTTATTVDVADFATDAPDLLYSAPALRLLGEVPGTGNS